MLSVTLGQFSRNDKYLILEVHMTPPELSRFSKTHPAQKKKYHEVSGYFMLKRAYSAVPVLELVIGNDTLSRIDAVPGSIAG